MLNSQMLFQCRSYITKRRHSNSSFIKLILLTLNNIFGEINLTHKIIDVFGTSTLCQQMTKRMDAINDSRNIFLLVKIDKFKVKDLNYEERKYIWQTNLLQARNKVCDIVRMPKLQNDSLQLLDAILQISF